MSRFFSRIPEWDLYAKELSTRGHGYPLWGPDPSTEFGEVQLGDVGYLRKGHFCFLFNCMRPANHPTNSRGVPQGFEIFEPPDGRGPHSGTDVQNVVMPPHLLSGSLESYGVDAYASVGLSGTSVSAGTGAQYVCKEQTGALLMLNEPGHEKYLECVTNIKKYMKKHLDSWYQYVQARGLPIKTQDILFVTGYVKTSMWTVAAFRHRSSSGILSIGGGGALAPGITAAAGLNFSMSACRSPEVFHRCGPVARLLAWDERAGRSNPSDQCIFLDSIQMKPRMLRRLRASAGPHELPSGSEDRGTYSEMQAIESDEEDNVPGSVVDVLLDYILRNSKAHVACASARQLFALFPRFPDDLRDAIDRLNPQVALDEDGIGTVASAMPTSSGKLPVKDTSIAGPANFAQLSLSETLRLNPRRNEWHATSQSNLSETGGMPKNIPTPAYPPATKAEPASKRLSDTQAVLSRTGFIAGGMPGSPGQYRMMLNNYAQRMRKPVVWLPAIPKEVDRALTWTETCMMYDKLQGTGTATTRKAAKEIAAGALLRKLWDYDGEIPSQ